jgi:very-short-patch-repair endonuclease
MFRQRPTTNARFQANARTLRCQSTPLESRLWSLLRDRRLVDFKFRRQVPIGRFVADFACFDAKLIVELDGSQHAENPYDTQRDAELAQRGFQILRVWNSDLTSNRDGVLEAIYTAARERTGRG